MSAFLGERRKKAQNNTSKIIAKRKEAVYTYSIYYTDFFVRKKSISGVFFKRAGKIWGRGVLLQKSNQKRKKREQKRIFSLTDGHSFDIISSALLCD